MTEYDELHDVAGDVDGMPDSAGGCREQDGGLGWVIRHPGPWFAMVWAPLLLFAPLVDAVAGGQVVRFAALVVLGGGFVATVALPVLVSRRASRWWISETAVVVLLLLCTVYLFSWSADRAFIFPLLAIASAVAVRPWWALSVISALTISGAIAAGLEGRSLAAGMSLGFATFLAGAAVYLVQRLIRLVGELTRTQNRLARAAVAEERLRFSRDLHDLLGHTLSVIVVKAEAVRRLLAVDPTAAGTHAVDIETIGRQALAEVREAATGYRSVSLGEEIANASDALRADDIDVDISVSARVSDAKTDTLLGWVVREGTTNVLRHSKATLCRIDVRANAHSVLVEITDNGDGGNGSAVESAQGNGLRGLRERLEGAGGQLRAGATANGFRLVASLPRPSGPGER